MKKTYGPKDRRELSNILGKTIHSLNWQRKRCLYYSLTLRQADITIVLTNIFNCSRNFHRATAG
jgi:hypothetical protein